MGGIGLTRSVVYPDLPGVVQGSGGLGRYPVWDQFERHHIEFPLFLRAPSP